MCTAREVILLRCHALTEREWKLVEAHTFGHLGAELYRGDLPERFNPWKTVVRSFRRWALAGVWQASFHAVQEPDYA